LIVGNRDRFSKKEFAKFVENGEKPPEESGDLSVDDGEKWLMGKHKKKEFT
jgi:hypothetical protein